MTDYFKIATDQAREHAAKTLANGNDKFLRNRYQPTPDDPEYEEGRRLNREAEVERMEYERKNRSGEP